MAPTTEEAWLDVMPAIPLERGVCVRVTDVTGSISVAGVYLERVQRRRPPATVLVWFPMSGEADCADTIVRVDLSTANGFGRAFGWLWRQRQGFGALLLVARRHWAGETTDADRLVLARACTEAS